MEQELTKQRIKLNTWWVLKLSTILMALSAFVLILLLGDLLVGYGCTIGARASAVLMGGVLLCSAIIKLAIKKS